MSGIPQNYGPGEAIVLTDGATIAITNGASGPTITGGGVISAQSGNFYAVTLGGNRTMAAFQNFPDGATIYLRVKQDGTGSRTLTWNSNVAWQGGTAPTLTTTANASDLLQFVFDTSLGKWIGRAYATNIS